MEKFSAVDGMGLWPTTMDENGEIVTGVAYRYQSVTRQCRTGDRIRSR